MIAGFSSKSSHPALGQADLPAEDVVVVLEDGTRVEGSVTVPRRGARLSDFLAQSDREFITVAKASIRYPSGETEELAFTMIGRRFVKLIGPRATDG